MSWPPLVQCDGSPLSSLHVTVAAMRPARSGWERSTPVSTMPTRTLAPVLVAHAVGAFTFWMFQSWPKAGSFDACAGAANTTSATAASAATTFLQPIRRWCHVSRRRRSRPGSNRTLRSGFRRACLDERLHPIDPLLHPERVRVPVDARRLVGLRLLRRPVQADVEVGVGGAVLF